MANITILELRPAGSELFQDSESFLNELTDREMVSIAGGGKRVNVKIKSVFVGVTVKNDVDVNSNVKIGC